MSALSAEEAKNMVGNRYDLVLIASIRAREVNRMRAANPFAKYTHSAIVTSIHEIEQGLVGRDYLKKLARVPKSHRQVDNTAL